MDSRRLAGLVDVGEDAIAPKNTARSRSGTWFVSLFAGSVLIVLIGLRIADSFTYLESFSIFLTTFALAFTLVVLWVVLVVMLARERRFRWGPIVILMGFVLFCINPAGGAIHSWGFQMAKPGLEAALASGECPAWAGPYRIEKCRTMEGRPFYVLADSGWDSIDGLVKPVDPTHFDPDGVSIPQGDGWFFVRIGF